MTIQLNIINVDGKPLGKIDLSANTFAVDFNESLVHQVVIAYQAGARSGTRAQKNRSAVSGGGAKPWRQKGTGRARAGTIRSPIFARGGRAFPASNQDFSQKLNKKMYRFAMRSILSELVRHERVVVVDDLTMEEPKTKNLLVYLQKLNINNGLVVLAEANENIEKSARNIHKIEICESSQINPVDLIRFEKILVTKQAVKNIDEAFNNEK